MDVGPHLDHDLRCGGGQHHLVRGHGRPEPPPEIQCGQARHGDGFVRVRRLRVDRAQGDAAGQRVQTHACRLGPARQLADRPGGQPHLPPVDAGLRRRAVAGREGGDARGADVPHPRRAVPEEFVQLLGGETGAEILLDGAGQPGGTRRQHRRTAGDAFAVAAPQGVQQRQRTDAVADGVVHRQGQPVAVLRLLGHDGPEQGRVGRVGRPGLFDAVGHTETRAGHRRVQPQDVALVHGHDPRGQHRVQDEQIPEGGRQRVEVEPAPQPLTETDRRTERGEGQLAGRERAFLHHGGVGHDDLPAEAAGRRHDARARPPVTATRSAPVHSVEVFARQRRRAWFSRTTQRATPTVPYPAEQSRSGPELI